ncbi:unnamed protein product [Bursaphelenchus xylophilus]|uniref:(pine wood nematode) hypothetical protein n=1 Tax=Bursaphelenchus xylophilus TaxID=6326 RepID=A0A1I7S5Y1_BURXY|nr:unnamed protein product [Bursaphelenchus xylophilus]CAG9082528.1 unnamed protein product [Bursaphelenchus xylophilus]
MSRRVRPARNENNKWAVPAERLAGGETAAKWKKLSATQKALRILLVILKLKILLLIIFCFICTLNLLTDAFKLLGVKGVGMTIKTSPLILNPVSASIIGMLCTLLFQNGSTLVSILVGMVASGLISVHHALPMIIGSEMGASLTNVLISMGQSGDRNKFRRSFAAATLNDAFNVLNYLTLLPLEICTGVIENLSGKMVKPLVGTHTGEIKTLNMLTDPLLELIVHIDDDAINADIAAATDSDNSTVPSGRETFIYRCVNVTTKILNPNCKYNHLFAYSYWSDALIGSILLTLAILSLIFCLVGIVQTMQSLLAGRVAVMVRQLLDQECPGPFKFLTGYIVMLFGVVVVFIVQSNSVFRSALTPLVGIGVVTLDRLYPLLLGANMGSSFTGILAALSSDPAKLRDTLQIALCETLCNVFGAIAFYPIPCLRRIPMNIAMQLGDLTARYRWFALVYIFLFFFIMPLSLLGLTLLPTWATVTAISLLIFFITFIITVNWAQSNHPDALPAALQSWNWLPRPLHSLRPYDNFIRKYFGSVACCRNHFVSTNQRKKSSATNNISEMFARQSAEEKAAVQDEENRLGFIREIMRTPPPQVGHPY